MKKFTSVIIMLLVTISVQAQSVSQKIHTAFSAFEKDQQMKNGIASLHVIDATGTVVFSKNSNIGLAPASTQKVITSATAYELLGKDFRYRTGFSLSSTGDLLITPSGDPTLGSWRWKETNENEVMKRVVHAIKTNGVRQVNSIRINENRWQTETIPGGWIWDDIANYYGAGAEVLNWRENQFDLILKSGNNIGDAVTIGSTKPALYHYNISSVAKAAAKGTGDNAYIYFPVGRNEAVVRGTIPAGENSFTISGAMPSSRRQFTATLSEYLSNQQVDVKSDGGSAPITNTGNVLHSEVSPPLDSISFWFLRRSINLYGEALIKTIAFTAGMEASTFNGVKQLKKFWSEKNIGMENSELNMFDGSGLSPLNRVTTSSQVAVLSYAKKQPWFSSFYTGFPEYNKMKIKSGTINGVKGFCGYHKSAAGKEYIFSFIVNNYNGSASGIVQKMYTVLDVLK